MGVAFPMLWKSLIRGDFLGCRRLNRHRLNRHEASGPAAVEKLDPAVDLCEQSVVAADPDVGARLQTRAALAMIEPPVTNSPPNALTPSRCALESRPFFELPSPFLCAIAPPYAPA